MLSKGTLALLSMASVLLTACDGTFYARPEMNNAIGEKLEDMSSLNDDTGTQINKIVIYDETVGRIHQFNLDTMNVERSLAVMNPTLPHTVLYNLPGNYVIDFTNKHISVFDRNGRAVHNPIRFVGTPKSAAFRPSLGLIVIYDSLMSVGMMKIGPNGEVLKSWKGGPDLGSNRTIAAGDIDDGGRLILALSDDTLVKIDLDATMTSGTWTVIGSPIATGLTKVDWVAPVRGQADQVMVGNSTKVEIVDTNAGAVLGSAVTMTGSVVKHTKGIDAHIFTTDYTEGGVRMYYADAGAIQSKQLYNASGSITHSRLDKTSNNLTLVTEGYSAWRWTPASGYSTVGEKDRMIRQWRFTDLDAQVEEKVVDDAKLALANRSLFALKNNKLGWALNYDLFSGGAPVERRNFNVPYIP